MAVIALDLGGTKLASAIFTNNGRIRHRTAVALDGRTGPAVGQLISEQIQTLLTTALKEKLCVAAIGMAVPGISYPRTGTVWAPNIPGWKAYPLRREILSALRSAHSKIKVTSPPSILDLRSSVLIESDRACYIRGEVWRGAAQACKNAIFLAVGTGIGAGILVDGTILRGTNDIAGAIGWLALDRPFRTAYSCGGCFEYHASGTGLSNVAKNMLRKHRANTGLHSSRLGSASEIIAAFRSHDPIAKAVFAQAIDFWGMAVANLVSLFNPEKIIFGGGVFGPATRFLPQIYHEAKKWAQPVAIKQVKLVASKLGPDAGLYGAACLALKNSQRRIS